MPAYTLLQDTTVICEIDDASFDESGDMPRVAFACSTMLVGGQQYQLRRNADGRVVPILTDGFHFQEGRQFWTASVLVR